MSERKVLNKYYPPDFDPSKIPRLREAHNKVFSIRIMAPFNMRCNVCGEYIYKGKKFNSRKENVEDEYFLGLRIFRFYIRCPKCVAEIAFKTDLKNTDYTLEAGATRLFEAERLAKEMAEQERLEKEAEELNPMTVLENRTKASHKEMAQIDELEELREINARHAKVDTNVLFEKQKLYEEHLLKLQQEEEDKLVQSIFGNKQGQVIKRLPDSDSEDDSDSGKNKRKKLALATDSGKTASDLLVESTDTAQSSKTDSKKVEPWQKSHGLSLSSKQSLVGLVRKKTASKTTNSTKTATNGSATATNASATAPSAGATSSSSSAAETNGSTAVSSGGAAVSSNSEKVPSGSGTSTSTSGLGLLAGYSDSESNDSS